jgi:putative effector of murein hydrolase LrgA (UPF0299 family)
LSRNDASLLFRRLRLLFFLGLPIGVGLMFLAAAFSGAGVRITVDAVGALVAFSGLAAGVAAYALRRRGGWNP